MNFYQPKKPRAVAGGKKLLKSYWQVEYLNGTKQNFDERPQSTKDMKYSPTLVKEFAA